MKDYLFWGVMALAVFVIDPFILMAVWNFVVPDVPMSYFDALAVAFVASIAVAMLFIRRRS